VRTTVDTFRTLLQGSVPTPYVGRLGSALERFMPSAGGDRAAQLASYGGVGTLFAIVSNLAVGTSQVQWHLYRTRTDARRRYGPAPDDRTEVTAHQALNVQKQPNPFMPWQEFCESIQQHVDLTGEGWWAVEFTPIGRIPLYLWPVRPDRMRPVPDREEFLSGYIYRSPDGEEVPLGLDEIISIRMPNPMDIYRGMGPVQALMTDLDSAQYSADWNRAFFMNSAQPGGIIEVERALSDGEFKQMVTRWRESHQGVQNAHRVGILEHGKWRDVQFSMKDMQFAELRNVSREIIREAFSYPKFMLGEPEGSNRASAMAAEYVEARRLIVPRADRWKAALNFDFLPLFGTTGGGLEWDYDSPVPDDPETEAQNVKTKAEAWAILVGEGVDPEDAAEVVCLPPMRMTEPEPVPAQLQPVPPPADPDDDAADDDDEEPETAETVAARARAILESGGLARGIINGHSWSAEAGGRAR
jgi:HK97 family phage portal protein